MLESRITYRVFILVMHLKGDKPEIGKGVAIAENKQRLIDWLCNERVNPKEEKWLFSEFDDIPDPFEGVPDGHGHGVHENWASAEGIKTFTGVKLIDELELSRI